MGEISVIKSFYTLQQQPMTRPNDFIRDANGATYRIGTLLGRGLFANTYTARSEDGADIVVKRSLGPQDFPEDSSHLVKLSRAVMDEQWQLLSRRPSDYILAPTHHFISEDGRYCLVYPRNDHSIRQHIGQVRSYQELLRTLVRCVQALKRFPSGLLPHGNIHPNNIFWDGKNIQFMDPLTPLLRLHHAEFLQAKGATVFTPPEYKSPRHKKGNWDAQIGNDTYALCLLLMGRLVKGSEAEVTSTGLSKLLTNNVEQSIQLLMQENPSSNPHFHKRVLRQSLRLIDRGLSVEPSPSPPYRFANLEDFQNRLQDIIDFSNPSVSKVGPILFGGPLGKGTFEIDDSIGFSCSIHTTPTLEDHDDITTGTILVDLDRNGERVDGYELWVDVSRLNGGRLRFQFDIQGVPPGNYGLFIGFRVNGSVATPKDVYAELTVTAPAGYSPDTPVVPPKTLQFPTTTAVSTGDNTQTEATLDSMNAVVEHEQLQDSNVESNSDAPTDNHDASDASTSSLSPSNSVQSGPTMEKGRHPLLKGKTPSAPKSNASIKIPQLDKVRRHMVIPDDEFAPPMDTLGTPLPFTQPVRSQTPQKPSPLRIVPSSVPEETPTGPLHSSPFSVHIESLLEHSIEEYSEGLSFEPHTAEVDENLSYEEHDISSEVRPYTDSHIPSEALNEYSEELSEPASEALSEEFSDDNPPSPPRKQTVANQLDGNETEVLENIFHTGMTKLRQSIEEDPFRATIIGLIALIGLFGSIILAL